MIADVLDTTVVFQSIRTLIAATVFSYHHAWIIILVLDEVENVS